jgi:hypothetical protein
LDCGRGLPHSKTLPRIPVRSGLLAATECLKPLQQALSSGSADLLISESAVLARTLSQIVCFFIQNSSFFTRYVFAFA